jgi:alpha-galactosidase
MRLLNLHGSRIVFWLSLAISILLNNAAALAGNANFKTCYARWNETNLVIGNAHIERTWQIQDGLLTAVSFRDLDTGVEWIAKPANRPAPFPGGKVPDEQRAISISARFGQFSPVEARSLIVEMTATGRETFHYRFQIFPEARGIAIRFRADVNEGDRVVATNGVGNSLEDLLLAPEHLKFTQVALRDQTDTHNELVSEKQWMLTQNEKDIQAKGNVFFVENVLTGTGLIFLKQAPLPNSRPVNDLWDARVTASPQRLCFAGQGYTFILLAYSGGRGGRIAALQNYQRQLRTYDPRRDGMFLSNTWGDRSRDSRINEEFMLKEVAAGARLGVDVVQIDDGWQKGRSGNSAFGKGPWEGGFWADDSHFWDVNSQRFPDGLDKIVAAACANGMKFGLWFAPDSTHDFANWQRDADRILDLYRTNGINYFKLDSINFASIVGENNLHRLFDRVLEKSNGKIVMDLDVTGSRGVRPGYFGAPEIGPIFVENRYTDSHGYFPHLTLRNLWELSQYVDPLRLRMEFLNNSRNTNLYAGDPLAPARYQPDCLFAIVMFANPLGWFETSNLPGNYFTSATPLIKIWKQERTRLYSGTIIPIGNAPDGMSWTGFVSVGQDRHNGYVLLFRELNKNAEYSTDLSMFAPELNRVTVLAGDGAAKIESGKLIAQIPETLRYLWVRLETDAEQ